MKKPKSVPDPCILLDFPDHTAWISGCDTVRRNVFHDYTAGSDSDIVTYGDTRNYGDATSDPDIVPDSDARHYESVAADIDIVPYCDFSEAVESWGYVSCRFGSSMREDFYILGNLATVPYRNQVRLAAAPEPGMELIPMSCIYSGFPGFGFHGCAFLSAEKLS